jgi:vitamin B12 transporter
VNIIFKALPLVLLAGNCALAQEQNRLDEIVVTSSRIEMPMRHVATAMSVIDRDELDLKGYSSLADVLRSETSVGVSNSGGPGQQTTLRVRGEEGYRTLLLIDGVDVSDASATQKGPLFQNIASSYDIERIEILRGPQGFMYGADAGGIVNVITGSGEQGIGGRLNAEAGSLGTQNFGGSFYAGSERADLSLSVSRFEMGGINIQQGDTLLADLDGSTNKTLHAKGSFDIQDNLIATLVYRNIDLEYDYDGCFDSATFTTVHDCAGANDQENIRLSLDYSGDSFTHALSYSAATIDRNSYSAGALSFAAQSDSSQLEYLGSYALAPASKLVYGADYEEDEMSNNFGAEGDRDQLGLFAEYQTEFGNGLFVTAGLRRDDNSDFGQHTSGRVSGAYLFELANQSSVKLRATYGTGFRAPSLAEVSYNSGPTQFGTTEGVILGEELSRGFDVGAELLLAQGALLQISYFDQRIDDEIFYEFDSISFEDGYRQESGSSRSKGVEFGAEVPLSEAFGFDASYTYNDTQDSSGQQRVRRPTHLASLGFRYSLMDSRLNLLTNLRYSADARDRFTPLSDYALLDVMANYQFNSQLQFFGRIENLADEDYVEITGFNTSGRTAYLGARYSF